MEAVTKSDAGQHGDGMERDRSKVRHHRLPDPPGHFLATFHSLSTGHPAVTHALSVS
jgi:hypothetical protein